MVYGDSRADDDCKGNAVHIELVRRMAAANPAFVVHLGDMVTGFASTTNFVRRGSCPEPGSTGSLKEIIAPLTSRLPPPGLPAAFFPVIGNHDDGWRMKWYPDSHGDGICDVFFLRGLVSNHTQMPYYRSKKRTDRLPDEEFYRLLCSKSEERVYPRFAYYAFSFRDAHFIVLHVNNNFIDLGTCRTCRDQTNYDDFHNIHQMHWLEDELAAARRNPRIRSTFVLLHAPLFGSGSEHPNTRSWRKLAELFTRYGVKVAFSSHSHVYERSVPVSVASEGSRGVRDHARGTVYVTTGGGGSRLHGFRDPVPWFSAFRRPVFHYVEVRVDGERIDLRAIDVEGRVFDEARR